MTRTEAIDLINRTAARLDDERVQVLLSVARNPASSPTQDPADPPKSRKLSVREVQGLEQSKADFAEGRVLDQQQYEESMAEFMTLLKAEPKDAS